MALQLKNVNINYFKGPHPSGNVGVQVHHVNPIKHRQDIVWYLDPQHLITIGKLFYTGIVDSRRIISTGGLNDKSNQYYQSNNL